MSTGLDAARRRFPLSLSQIERLISQDEGFRELCNDLAAAEAARTAVDWPRPSRRSSGRMQRLDQGAGHRNRGRSLESQGGADPDATRAIAVPRSASAHRSGVILRMLAAWSDCLWHPIALSGSRRSPETTRCYRPRRPTSA